MTGSSKVGRLNLAIAFVFLGGASSTLGEITRTVDLTGTVHLSNVPPAGSRNGADAGAIDPSRDAAEGPPPGCRSPAAGVLTRYPSVEIFGVPTCPWTDKTREFFRRNRVPFQYFDIGADRDAEARLK